MINSKKAAAIILGALWYVWGGLVGGPAAADGAELTMLAQENQHATNE